MKDPEAPVPRVPVFQSPLSDVEVWPTGSAFVQRTVSPTCTVIGDGENVKFWIVTLPVAAITTNGTARSAIETHAAAAHAMAAARVTRIR